jgi:hypothetical protein
MKPSFLIGLAAGYVLGSRAGRERYEDIVRVARRVAGSQTIQATAGVIGAQLDELTGRARARVAARFPHVNSSTHHAADRGNSNLNGVNGTRSHRFAE